MEYKRISGLLGGSDRFVVYNKEIRERGAKTVESASLHSHKELEAI